jgi:hypothetical protein
MNVRGFYFTSGSVSLCSFSWAGIFALISSSNKKINALLGFGAGVLAWL